MITEKQKQQRTLGLFSSDAPRLMMGEGVQLWLEKTGQVEPENLDDNPRVQLGNVLESVILMAASTTLDKVVLSPPNTFYHPEHSRLGAHLDGVVNDEPTVVEAKAVSAYIKDREGWGEPGTDEVPDKVIWQVQHQLL